MPKRTDIHKVLVIGSGPIVIGQAAALPCVRRAMKSCSSTPTRPPL